MPGTFPVQVAAYFHGPDGLKKFGLEVVAREGGVCYVGRDKEGDEQTKLVMTEAAIDELLAAVDAIAPDHVHMKTKNALTRLKTAKSLSSMLQQGLPVPRSDKAGFAPIEAMIPDESGQDQKATIGLVGQDLLL